MGKKKTPFEWAYEHAANLKNISLRIINDLKRCIESFTGETIRLIWNDLSINVRQKSIIGDN